jgi:ribosomal protein S18 acetylase RimI-like enzyme
MKIDQLNYTTRKAELKDVMYFLESINTQIDSTLDFHKFNDQFKKKVKDKTSIVLLLEVDKKSVGFIIAQAYQTLSDPLPLLEIQELFIAPKFRKLKAAEILFSEFVDKAKVKGYYKLKVNCNINSTLNQNFYITKGFKIQKKQYHKSIY